MPRPLETLPRKQLNIALKVALYLWIMLVGCPIRYWPLQTENYENGVDETWRFALNYAHAHGIKTVFTSGPWGYLIFPEGIGHNLASALKFQLGLWLALAVIFGDAFFRIGLPLRNLVLFSICFGLSAPLFWFDYLGTENLMLSGALVLLVMFHLRGSILRYLGALLLIAPLVFLKLTAAMIGLGAISGFLIDRAIQRRGRSLPEIALAITTIGLILGGLGALLTPSVKLLLNYLEGSAQIADGYSSAMSSIGANTELLCAAEATAVLAFTLWQTRRHDTTPPRFYTLLLIAPLFVSFKHGFTRQDHPHITNFFSFVALSLALISFTLDLRKGRLRRIVPLMIIFLVIWQDTMQMSSLLIAEASGLRSALTLWHALPPTSLQQRLNSPTSDFPEALRIEQPIADLVGDSTVASLSTEFTNLAAAGMHIGLYPVVQRYSAYTPYLDGLNAAWIRDDGPKFLVFDGKTIDNRDPWLETPAMWLEIYRWYNTRCLGPRNLLLQRRTSPRFKALETIDHRRITLPGTLRLPTERGPLFWTLTCRYNTEGSLRKLLFRVPPTAASLHETTGATRVRRVLPEELASPSIGNYLPGNLEQFAALFQAADAPSFTVDSIGFEGPGIRSLKSTCALEILRPTQ